MRLLTRDGQPAHESCSYPWQKWPFAKRRQVQADRGEGNNSNRISVFPSMKIQRGVFVAIFAYLPQLDTAFISNRLKIISTFITFQIHYHVRHHFITNVQSIHLKKHD
jgi:hypothetical protein